MDTLPPYLNRYRQALHKFVGFTDEEWQLFSQGLYIEQIKKKKFFVEAGDVCKKVSLIITGSVRFYVVKDGEEITNYFCFENEWVSAYSSFLKQRPSPVYIEALQDTVLVTFTYQFLQQCYASPQLAYKSERFGRLIAEYLIGCYEDRLASFLYQSPEERYLQLLKTNITLMQYVPQHYIANYLGITPVSLSRIRKRIMHTN